MTPYVPYHIQE